MISDQHLTVADAIARGEDELRHACAHINMRPFFRADAFAVAMRPLEGCMVKPTLSIDPSGQWSAPQVRAVLSIIQPEAHASGIEFHAIDITSQEMPARRFLLSARCLKHQHPVAPESACELCLAGVEYAHAR